jgi:hypothetical protein
MSDRAALCLDAMEEAYTRARAELKELRWEEPEWVKHLDAVADKYLSDSLYERGLFDE